MVQTTGQDHPDRGTIEWLPFNPTMTRGPYIRAQIRPIIDVGLNGRIAPKRPIHASAIGPPVCSRDRGEHPVRYNPNMIIFDRALIEQRTSSAHGGTAGKDCCGLHSTFLSFQKRPEPKSLKPY